MTAIWQQSHVGAALPAAPISQRLRKRSAAPLRLGLVNLMPNKPVTERQFAKAFAAAGRPVEWTLTLPEGYRPTTTPESHLQRFYTSWEAIDLRRLDGVIVTGAPVEHLAYEEVHYWPALTRLFDQLEEAGLPSLFICWSAQAALYHRHGAQKRVLPEKCFGVFEQHVLVRNHPILRGLGDRFHTPVSRHTEVRAEDLPGDRGLQILADSSDSGLCLIADPAASSAYMFNHLEYETETLGLEYERDRAAGTATAWPFNYYSRRIPGVRPINLWYPATQQFFANWIACIQPDSLEKSLPILELRSTCSG